MPQGFVNDFEGEISDEKLHEGALGNDIFSSNLDGEDALLLNIRVYRTFGVAHDIGRFVCSERVYKVGAPNRASSPCYGAHFA